MRFLRPPSKRTLQILAYAGAASCAALFIIGMLAAIVETASVVRIYGALTAIAAAVVGYHVGRHAWLMDPNTATDAETIPVSLHPTDNSSPSHV